MLEVSEIRPDAAKEPRERDGHPRLLQPRGQMKRLDSLRDEVGPAGDGGEPEVGRRGRQLAQEVRDVRLVPGPLAAQDVGVDRADHATSS